VIPCRPRGRDAGRRGRAIFPRAEVFISVDEREALAGSKPPTDALGISEQVNSYAPQLRKVYGDRWHAIGEEEVIPGMRREALPGHSGYHLSSGKDELLIWGDITHVPVVQIAHPDVGLAFDVDVEQGRATRRRILDRIAADGLAIGGMHLARVPGLRPCGAQRLGLRICARFVDARYLSSGAAAAAPEGGGNAGTKNGGP
jgi:hypothetical protein